MLENKQLTATTLEIINIKHLFSHQISNKSDGEKKNVETINFKLDLKVLYCILNYQITSHEIPTKSFISKKAINFTSDLKGVKTF